MELSPQSVASTTFRVVKKGYDPDEVKAYLTQLAGAIETTQNQATAMEARARAAVVRLQEIAAQTPQQTVEAAPKEQPADETATISRTLLLAQRTADSTVAEANEEAKRITDSANAEARNLVSGAQEVASRMVEEAKADARRAADSQRIQVESEVQSLLARREFLLSDVEHLEQHIVTQRDRLRDVASTLSDIVTRVPGGLGDLRRPLVSAVTDAEETPLDPTAPLPRIETDMVAADEPADEPAADAAPSPTDPTPPHGEFLFEDITDQLPAVQVPIADSGSAQ